MRERRQGRRDMSVVEAAILASVVASAAGMVVLLPHPLWVVEDPANPGYVLRFLDLSDVARYFEQTDPTKQVAMPVLVDGKYRVTFTGGQWYQSNLTAADWAIFQGSAARYSAAIYEPTSSADGDNSWRAQTHESAQAATRGGAMLSFNTGGNSIAQFNMSNGSANIMTTSPTLDAPAVSSGIRLVSNWVAGSASGSAWAVRGKGAQLTAGTLSAAASASAPPIPLRIGANPADTARMKCHMYMFFMSPTDRPAAFTGYALSRYGLAA